MKWDYTETLTKKDLIDILRGMADSLESKGELEAWIGNTKIVVDVAPQFILETIFNEDRQKGETHFHFHLSWVHEPEEQIPAPARASSEETISSQFEEIPPGEEKLPVAHEEFLIDTTASSSTQAPPPTPTEAMTARQAPHVPEPPSPQQDTIMEDIPLPPSSDEAQQDWRKSFDKEMAEFGIPIESKASSETVEEPKPPVVSEPAPSRPVEATVASADVPASVQALEMYSVYESAFGWNIQNEWSEINPGTPGITHVPHGTTKAESRSSETSAKYLETKKELRDIETKPPEELEQELFGDLDDDEDHLVRPSDFLKKGRKKQ